MGGTITATSRVGEGSVFRFSVRLRAAVAGMGSAEPRGASGGNTGSSPAPRRPIRILVAEDNRTNQLVIRAMLEKLGHRADVVGNGLEAVEAISARPYDLVLMDVMMPDLDGIGATRLIRQLPGPEAAVPIVALTAHASAETHVTFRDAGMDGVVTKPVTLNALTKMLAGYARQEASLPG